MRYGLGNEFAHLYFLPYTFLFFLPVGTDNLSAALNLFALRATFLQKPRVERPVAR
jgi:hypothetical protein